MKKLFLRRFLPSLSKDFILICRISIVEIIIIGLLLIKFSLDYEQSKITEKTSIAANQVEKLISSDVRYLKYQLFYVSQQIKTVDTDKDVIGITKILSSFTFRTKDQLDVFINWNSFSWVDKKNKMISDGVHGLIKNPIDVSGRDYLKKTTENSDQLVFGEAVLGVLSNRLIIPIGVGVFSQQQQYLGTLVFGLDMEIVLQKILRLIGDEDFDFVIINNNKIAIESANISAKEQDLAKQYLTEFSNDPNKNFTSSWWDVLFGGKAFFAVKNVKESPLTILAFYDPAKSFDQLLKVLLKQLFFVFLVICSCVILFRKIRRRIVEPVSELSKFALKIAEGDFEFVAKKPKSAELLDLFAILSSVRNSAKREKNLMQQLELTNRQLSKANDAKAEFLAKSSHDIKNYIFGILGLSRIILQSKDKERILANEELQMIEIIADQSKELMHFVEDLLDTNQIEVGEFVLDKMQLCDLGVLIERIVLLNKSLATRHKVMVYSKISQELPKIKCDVRRMKQILFNIITNAIKYSKEGGEVNITVNYSKDDKNLCVKVIDQGIGMEKDEIEMLLLGKGRNIDKSDVAEIDSHGLGMQIVLNLIKLHNGTIEITSQKGQGTTIKMCFKVEDLEQKVAVENLEVETQIQGYKTILLVEDNPTNIKITAKILQSVGYKVLSAENGSDAIKMLDDNTVDLILMDGEMPIMNGYDATRKIREGLVFKNFQNYKNIPIIALMSSSDAETIKRALASGMNLHLDKSSSRTKLLSTIEDCLK